MNYIYQLIKKHIPDVNQGHAEKIVRVMIDNGYVSTITEQHFEIYTFYKEKVRDCEESGYPLKVAMVDTMDHFKITMDNVYKICRKFDSHLNDS